MLRIKATVKYSVRFKALRLLGIIITTDKLFRKTCIIEDIKINKVVDIEDDTNETITDKKISKN